MTGSRWRSTLQRAAFRFPRFADWLINQGVLRWLGMSGADQTQWIAETLHPAGRLLDVPIGTGSLTTDLYTQRPAVTVIGIDDSLAQLQSTRARLIQQGIVNIHLVCADSTALPFSNDRFDQIVSVNGIQHVKYPETFVDELLRVGEDGCVVVGTATVDIGLEPRGGLQRLLVRLGLIQNVNAEKLHELLGLTWSKLTAQRIGAVYHFRRVKLDRATGEPIRH